MKNPVMNVTKEEEFDDFEEDNVHGNHGAELNSLEYEEDRKFQEIVNLMAESSPHDHPQVIDVRNWKSKYGKIYMSTVVEDTEIYVWRPILRQEWKELISRDFADDMLRQEALLEKCLLFPRIETVKRSRPAGILAALETKVMFQSGFVSPEYLLSSIREIK